MKKHFYVLATFLLYLCSCQSADVYIYVSPTGLDSNPGTLDAPVASLAKAQEIMAGYIGKQPITIFLREGTYYIQQPVLHHSTNSGTEQCPITYKAFEDEKVVISSAKVLNDLKWEVYHQNILCAKVDDNLHFDQLFVNGEKQHAARYPNYDPEILHYNGFAADAIAPERVANWKNPSGGIIHALHKHEWGGYQYRITGKNADNSLELEGGFQNNRQMGMHDQIRMVENIFEELDTEKEWFWDADSKTLYYYPPQGLDLKNAQIEVPQLESIFIFQGTEETPVCHIKLQDLELCHTLYTFMKTREPLLRSDWTIYRGGCIVMDRAADCKILNCDIHDVGGNAIFFSNYNKNHRVENTHISQIGASGICFVGSPQAVRSPSFEYNQFVPFEELDMTPGPKGTDFPERCMVHNCLIHDVGLLEKQIAGIQISMSMHITVSQNSIYNLPRAGINISEGTWGGHLIEWNDVFNTVLETGDHGAFNSWGRDRFWHPDRKTLDSINQAHPDLYQLDAIATTIIRNNRFRCDHGWDIDLDDGSSNYHIANNLCLNGGLKFREGFNRIGENNILINNSFHPHAWFTNSQDVFKHNIVFRPYYPFSIHSWGKEVDYNFFTDSLALTEVQGYGTDPHSMAGHPDFVNPEAGDFRLKDHSPVFTIGFKNFEMDRFGVQYEKLKPLAKKPEIPALNIRNISAQSAEIHGWKGAKLKNMTTEGERSATGMDAVRGVLVIEVGDDSELARAGIMPNDVIILFNGTNINSWMDLEKEISKTIRGGAAEIGIFRNQKAVVLKINI